MHQGDFDGIKGVYHINAVDIVTQWEVVVCVEHISHSYMSRAVELLIEQFPFTLKGIHADNGVEYINWRMLELMEDARIRQTQITSPAQHRQRGEIGSENKRPASTSASRRRCHCIPIGV